MFVLFLFKRKKLDQLNYFNPHAWQIDNDKHSLDFGPTWKANENSGCKSKISRNPSRMHEKSFAQHVNSLASISQKAFARMVQNIRGNPASFRWLYADMIPRERSPVAWSMLQEGIKDAACKHLLLSNGHLHPMDQDPLQFWILKKHTFGAPCTAQAQPIGWCSHVTSSLLCICSLCSHASIEPALHHVRLMADTSPFTEMLSFVMSAASMDSMLPRQNYGP